MARSVFYDLFPEDVARDLSARALLANAAGVDWERYEPDEGFPCA